MTETPTRNQDEEDAGGIPSDYVLAVNTMTDKFATGESASTTLNKTGDFQPQTINNHTGKSTPSYSLTPDDRTTRSSPSSRASSPAPRPLVLQYQQKFILRGHRKGVSQVRYSPDGKWIASASADGSIRLWNAQNGRHLRTLEGHLAGISTIAWSPDSNTIASGSDDKTIRLWDRVTGKPYPVPLLGHHNYVFSLAFSPKGNMLASGSFDEAVFLWDLRARKQMRSLPAHSDPVGSVDFSKDGTLVCSCSTDGLMYFFPAIPDFADMLPVVCGMHLPVNV